MPWPRLRVPSFRSSRRPLATDSANELEGFSPLQKTHADAGGDAAVRLQLFASSSAELPLPGPQPAERRGPADFRWEASPCGMHQVPELSRALQRAVSLGAHQRLQTMRVYALHGWCQWLPTAVAYQGKQRGPKGNPTVPPHHVVRRHYQPSA